MKIDDKDAAKESEKEGKAEMMESLVKEMKESGDIEE